MKNALKKVGSFAKKLVAPAVMAGTITSASAAITTTDAEAKITAAVGFAETMGLAGLAIAGVWLAIRVIRKGIRSAS